MNIIFLNVDNALCTVGSRIYHKDKSDGYKFDTCLSITAMFHHFLERLNTKSETKVVIISSRITDVLDKKLLRRINWDCGVKGFLHDDWGIVDSQSITEWLSQHPEVDKYVVIDNTSVFKSEGHKFLDVDSDIGLTNADLELIERYFIDGNNNDDLETVNKLPVVSKSEATIWFNTLPTESGWYWFEGSTISHNHPQSENFLINDVVCVQLENNYVRYLDKLGRLLVANLPTCKGKWLKIKKPS